jgi:hypothetical protein
MAIVQGWNISESQEMERRQFSQSLDRFDIYQIVSFLQQKYDHINGLLANLANSSASAIAGATAHELQTWLSLPRIMTAAQQGRAISAYMHLKDIATASGNIVASKASGIPPRMVGFSVVSKLSQDLVMTKLPSDLPESMNSHVDYLLETVQLAVPISGNQNYNLASRIVLKLLHHVSRAADAQAASHYEGLILCHTALKQQLECRQSAWAIAAPRVWMYSPPIWLTPFLVNAGFSSFSVASLPKQSTLSSSVDAVMAAVEAAETKMAFDAAMFNQTSFSIEGLSGDASASHSWYYFEMPTMLSMTSTSQHIRFVSAVSLSSLMSVTLEDGSMYPVCTR